MVATVVETYSLWKKKKDNVESEDENRGSCRECMPVYTYVCEYKLAQWAKLLAG